MENKEITFNDLPQVVAQLRDEVMGMRVALERQQRREEVKPMVRADAHHRMTVAEAIAYTGLPKGTFYMKLEDGTIPALKPGKRWMLYQDELDKWLEANRRGSVPLTADEENEAILNSHRRKPNRHDWNDWSSGDAVSSSKSPNAAMASAPSSSTRKASGGDTTSTMDSTNAADTTSVLASANPANDVNPQQTEEPEVANKPAVTNEQSTFNVADATSSFGRMKDVYGKTGNNESQAFGVWQKLTEPGRTAAFAHAQRMQGDLTSRSYLYVYLRDKEWTK